MLLFNIVQSLVYIFVTYLIMVLIISTILNYPCRYPGNNHHRFDALRYNRTGSDNSLFPNFDAREDDRIVTDKGSVFYYYRSLFHG